MEGAINCWRIMDGYQLQNLPVADLFEPQNDPEITLALLIEIRESSRAD